MPALTPTSFEAEITWLGRVSADGKDLSATAADTLSLKIGGAEGEAHSGVTRPSCVRVTALYEKGTEIANVRQLSVLSQEELDLIAAEMGLEAIDPAWVGASIVLKGIPDFTHVPPNARLQGPDGATITVDMENRPCVLPGRVIEGHHPGHGPKFKAAAVGRRGVTAWVSAAGGLPWATGCAYLCRINRFGHILMRRGRANNASLGGSLRDVADIDVTFPKRNWLHDRRRNKRGKCRNCIPLAIL